MVKNMIDRDPKHFFIFKMFKAFSYDCSNLGMSLNSTKYAKIQNMFQSLFTRGALGPKTKQKISCYCHFWYYCLHCCMGRTYSGMGQIRAGSLFPSCKWTRTQRVVKVSTGLNTGSQGGQGLSPFLEIWNINIMFYGTANIGLPCLVNFVSKSIPTYCQSINIVGQL